MMNTLRITAHQFLTMSHHRVPMELIDGEIIVNPIPTPAQQRTVLRLARHLEKIASHGEMLVSQMDIHLDDNNVLKPDLFWLAPESLCVPLEEKHCWGAPDLVVEVTSPVTKHWDRGIKFELYRQHGAREFWLVDPDKDSVEVYWLEEGRIARHGVFWLGESFVSAVLGDVRIEVSAFLGM